MAAEKISRWRARPDYFVRECLGVTPDPWQDEVLQAFPHKQRIAMRASKGPGKTAVLAWLGWNFMLCYSFPKAAAVSITGPNLSMNLWPEMAKWQQKSPVLTNMFEWTSKKIFLKAEPERWKMEARSWSKSADDEELGNTLAGIHEDNVLFLLDESGGMPPAILNAAEGALSTAKVGRIVQAGNTSHLTGALYLACSKMRSKWFTVVINGDPKNPKRSPRISLDWVQDQIDMWGEDSQFVRVSVYGEFPKQSPNAIISLEEVEAATNRHYSEDKYQFAAKILGVDVAAFGDAASVIYPRQGLVMFTAQKFRNIDGMQGAGHVARKWNEWNADACFIDDTGGYGNAWIQALRQLHYDPIGVAFSGKPTSGSFANKRTEMAFDFVKWIKEGGAMPKDPNMVSALTETTYGYKGDKLILEPKENVKTRLGFSPDEMDSGMLTFAQPVMPSKMGRVHGLKPRHTAEYNPFSDEAMRWV